MSFEHKTYYIFLIVDWSHMQNKEKFKNLVVKIGNPTFIFFH